MILDAYLNSFAKACRTAGGWYALDLFAGTGLNWSTTRDRQINGSALIALEARSPEAIKVAVAESHAGALEALAHRTERYGGRVESFNEDANKIVAAMLGLIPRRAPAFAFLDPEGSELEWPTVEAIAEHKRGHSPNKIEQLILFPTDMGFVRLAPDHPELVTRIYGHDGWKDIYARRESGQISAEEARGEYVRMYAEGFKRLGYATVLDRQIKKSNGQPMYFLIFATDNDAPSLPMSCETLMIKELLTLEGENGARHDVGDGARWSRRPWSGGSRRRPERRGRRARRARGGPRS